MAVLRARTRRGREKLVKRYDADIIYAVRIGRAAALRIGAHAMMAAIRAYRNGGDPRAASGAALQELWHSLTDAMVYAALKGAERARSHVPKSLSLATTVNAYDVATEYAMRRANLTRHQINKMSDQFSRQAVKIVEDVSHSAERKIAMALSKITSQNLHVRDGVAELARAFDSAGIVPANSFTIESIYRTQTALAYGAGKRAIETSAEVSEILWGYQYSTVGDDRVRPEHELLDGTTLPKNDSFWMTSYPPNGYNCRCQAIPLYEDPGEIQNPPDGPVDVDGEMVTPGPDDGWGFDPAKLLSGVVSLRKSR